MTACLARTTTRLVLAATAATCLLAPATRAAQARANSGWFASQTLTYDLTPAKNADPRTATPRLNIAVGVGAKHLADMDTGSTGVVISATSLPDFATDPTIQAALKQLGYDATTKTFPANPDFTGLPNITYSSSGREMIGVTLSRSVTISDGAASATPGAIPGAVTTSPVNILAVLYQHCVPHARSCTPSNVVPGGVGVIGIGFAREKDHQTNGTPDRNPFLHVVSPARGALSLNGYIVHSKTVEVGIPIDELLRSHYRYVKLQPDTGYSAIGIKEWLPFQATITLDGGASVTGDALVDTGIPSMFMSVPYATAANLRVPVTNSTDATPAAETQFAIAMTGTHPSVGYGFTWNNGNDATAEMPTHVTFVGNDGTAPDDHATFVNTGYHFVDDIDYLYDYDFGWVGFQPTNGD